MEEGGDGRGRGQVARQAIPELPGILAGVTKAAVLLVSVKHLRFTFSKFIL